MCLFRRYRRQDRIARETAASLDMFADNLEGRKNGGQSIDDLNECDIWRDKKNKTEEYKKALGKESISPLSRASFIVSVFALFASLATIVVTVHMNNKTNELTERLNSKEYQISESLKYDIIELVSILRAIESKSFLARFVDDYEIDYSTELQMLKKIQTRPGYRVFLHSIDGDGNRHQIEILIQHFIDFYLTSPTTTSTEIGDQVQLILNEIGENTDLTSNLNMDFNDFIKDLCHIERMVPKEYDSLEHEERYCDFVQYLLVFKDYDDPDIEYYYSYFCEMDTLRAMEAVKKGAICVDLDEEYEEGFWDWYLWRNIKEKYSDEYRTFLKRR